MAAGTTHRQDISLRGQRHSAHYAICNPDSCAMGGMDSWGRLVALSRLYYLLNLDLVVLEQFSLPAWKINAGERKLYAREET